MTDKNEFHYFANHAMGWVTADTKEEAIEKLLLTNTEPKWANNCLKSGEPLVFFVCRVPLPADAKYRIEWYSPKVEGLTEGENRLVTYLTRTKFATMPDLRDEINKRKDKYHDLKKAAFNLAYSVARSQSIHDDSIQSSQDELRPFVDSLFNRHRAP